jgi:hypothetical protein
VMITALTPVLRLGTMQDPLYTVVTGLDSRT